MVDIFLLSYYVLDYGLVGTLVRTRDLPEPEWYRLAFPVVLHPAKNFFISASIFMVREKTRAVF